MNTRSERLGILAAELEEAMKGIARSIEPEAAVVFLERLARCEAFDVEPPIVREAAALRDREAARLSEAAAAGLDPDALLTRGYLLAQGDSDAGQLRRWTEELIRAAIVAPFVGGRAGERVREIVEETELLVEAHPEAFGDSALVAADLGAHEHPEKLACGDLVETLEKLPRLAMVDHASVTVGESSAAYGRSGEGWLDEVLARAPRELVEDAGAALRDAREWADRVTALRRPRQTGASREAPLRMAARRAGSLGEHVLLRKVAEGELLLTLDGDVLFLDWYAADGRAPRAAEASAGGVELVPTRLEGGLRWALPAGSAPLPLEVRVDGRRLTLVLPA